MKRFLALAACGFSLSACASMPGWMQFDLGKSAPAATTMQFESEPAGAEARISEGQSCRTPCSLAVTSSEFTVTFNLQGFQPQTVPVKVVPESAEQGAAARLVPNPVFVELQPAAGPPPAARRPPPARAARPKPAPRPAPTAMAPPPPPPAPAPAPAPASPWPPAR